MGRAGRPAMHETGARRRSFLVVGRLRPLQIARCAGWSPACRQCASLPDAARDRWHPPATHHRATERQRPSTIAPVRTASFTLAPFRVTVTGIGVGLSDLIATPGRARGCQPPFAWTRTAIWSSMQSRRGWSWKPCRRARECTSSRIRWSWAAQAARASWSRRVRRRLQRCGRRAGDSVTPLPSGLAFLTGVGGYCADPGFSRRRHRRFKNSSTPVALWRCRA
jgi:hypothetical protein